MQKEPIRIAQVMGKMVSGGLESVVMNYYRNIDREKIQFDFIIDEDSTHIPRDEIESLGGRIYLVPPYQHIFKYMKTLKKLFKNNSYRIVHSHLNTLSVFPLYCAKLAKVPVRIAHSHSTSNKKEWKKNILKNILKPFSKMFANQYFACSKWAGEWLFGEKVYQQGKIKIINNAIDLEKFTYNLETREKKRKELGLEGKFVVGHIGRFVKQKNHEFLIDVFEKLQQKIDNATLLLIGDGPLEKKVQQKIQELGIQEKVIFLGVREDVGEIYQAMDIFILPSIYEGLGMVAVEAQLADLPTFVSDEVPKEAKVTERIEFIKLSENSDVWSEKILNGMKEQKKERTIVDATDSVYNIKEQSKKLESYYIEKNKIKVCHFVSGLVSGGVEQIIYNYTKELDKDEFDTTIVYQHDPNQKNVDEFQKLGVKLINIPEKTKHPIKNFIRTFKIIKRERYDVIHCHMTLMNFIPLFCASLCKVRVRICHSHNFDNRKKSILIKVFEKICKILCKLFANCYLACGEEAGIYLYGKKKFTILNNVINIENFKFNNEIRERVRKNLKCTDQYVIGHIGRFTKQKNHAVLIKIFREVYEKEKDVILLLIGTGELQEDIKKEVVENGLQDKVIFLGNVNNANEIYQAMDIFLLPSLWEGLPVVGIEAQVSGLTCLFSNKITEAIKITEKSYMLDINDTDKWREAVLNNFYSNEDEREVVNLEKFDQLGYNPKKEVEKLKRVYRRN